MRRIILLIVATTLSMMVAHAQEVGNGAVIARDAVVTGGNTAVEAVDGDVAVKSKFLPMRRRIDRHIDLNKFVYKGEVMLGLTASHGSIKATDSDLMLLFDDINLGFKLTTIKPFIAYAYRNNRSVGMRFGYELMKGDLGNISLDLGSAADLSFSLSDLSLRSESYSWSLFHRNYIGLDRRGIIGAILETELLFKTGRSKNFTSTTDPETQLTSRTFSAKLNFNPGVAVYVFPEVCVTVSVGIGGLYYNTTQLIDAYDAIQGRRDRTGLQFKLNIANFQIGVVAHLWNRKRD